MRTLRPVAVLLLLCCLVAAGCGLGDSGGQESAAEAPPTARLAAATAPIKVVAAGDIACAPGTPVTTFTCRQAATAVVARSVAPAHVLALGDLQYQVGAYDAFLKSYGPTWGALKALTRPVPGNHEYQTAGAAGYYRYFGQRAPGYYAWNAGSWRIYNLNSNCDKIDCRAEARWLEADLAANPRKCSIIAMHHPRFSSGKHSNISWVQPLWEAAYRHRVDVALAGHDHDYERFLRKSPTGAYQPSRGIQSFVSGAGGKSLYPMGTRKVASAYFDARHFGVLVLHLDAGRYRWEYRTTDGAVRDAGSSTCL